MTVRLHPVFAGWLTDLKDKRARGLIAARLKRLEAGLFGDAKSVGDGIHELRIHDGGGWRIYYTMKGSELVIVLVGGPKSKQDSNIKQAKEIAKTIQG